MGFADVVQARMDDLIQHVSGLEGAKQHMFAPKSLEAYVTGTDERHVAVFPTEEPEVIRPAVAGSPPADWVRQTYGILVWEDAAGESSRRADDNAANLEWLELYEQIVERLYVTANRPLGTHGGDSHYISGRPLEVTATVRVMAITFWVETDRTWT